MKKLHLLIIFGVILSTTFKSYAQKYWDVHLLAGISKFNVYDRQAVLSVAIGNAFKYSKSASLGLNYNYDFKKSYYTFSSGLELNYISSLTYDPEEPEIKPWEAYLINFSVPLMVGYRFEKWFSVHLGVDNNINLLTNFAFPSWLILHKYSSSPFIMSRILIKNKFFIYAKLERNFFFSTYQIDPPIYRLYVQEERIIFGLGYKF